MLNGVNQQVFAPPVVCLFLEILFAKTIGLKQTAMSLMPRRLMDWSGFSMKIRHAAEEVLLKVAKVVYLTIAWTR